MVKAKALEIFLALEEGKVIGGGEVRNLANCKIQRLGERANGEIVRRAVMRKVAAEKNAFALCLKEISIRI